MAASFSGPTGSAAARIFLGSVSRQAKMFVTVKAPNPNARARRSQRSTVGSFCTSVAVDGFSMTNSALRPSGSHTRLRL